MKTIANNLIVANQQLQGIVATNDTLSLTINNLKAEHAVLETDELSNAIENILNQDRLMNIGVVGRVKAGKSSLLNALFFDGKNILPSAATPMTAALTTLTYGESFSASVELYSDKDIEIIKNKAEEYQNFIKREFDELAQKEQSKHQRKKDKRKSGVLNDEQTSGDVYLNEDTKARLLSRAERKAKQDIILNSAYDQYQRMQQSGMMNRLEEIESISANSLEELAENLLDFVGANGKLMPFTKSVNIALPLENLKDIRVIDTPGFNDPVQSREARTVELLKECDAIFIVSPAGQFMSEQDLDMMGRITEKEGVQEISIVASQIDMQFYASEKKETVEATIATITNNLANHLSSTMNKFKQNRPEIGVTFDKLINDAKTHLHFSSGISHAIIQKLQNGDNLNEGENHVWKSLVRHFPNEFDENQLNTAIETLDKMGNIAKLKEVIANVRMQKEAVLKERVEQFLSAKKKALANYQTALISETDNAIQDISSTDIQVVEAQINNNKKIQNKVEDSINQLYDNMVYELRSNTRNNLAKVIAQKYHDATSGIDSSKDEGSRTRTVNKSGALSWLARKTGLGGTETRTEYFTKVATPQVTNTVTRFINDIKLTMSEVSDNNEKMFKDKLCRGVVRSYRQAVGNDELVNEGMVYNIIKDLTHRELPMIAYQSNIRLPDEFIGRGTLTESSADNFLSEISKYVTSLYQDFMNEADNYQNSLVESLPKDIASRFTSDLEKETKQLHSQVTNKKMTIDRLTQFKTTIAEVQVA